MDHHLLLVLVSLTSVCIKAAEVEPPVIVQLAKDRTGDNRVRIDSTKQNSGNSLSLDCRAIGGGGNLQYQWHHNSLSISMGDARRRHFGGTLLINNVEKGDAGDYRCFVSSDHGTIFSRAVIIQLTYVGGFKVPDTQSNRKVIKAPTGLSLTLNCPDILPSQHITYGWGGHDAVTGSYLVPMNNRVTLRPNGGLLYSYFKQEDIDYSTEKDGISCRIETSDGHLSSFSHKFMLQGDGTSRQTPFSAVLLDKLDSSYEAFEGELLKLWCTATGNPAPTITWKKDGKEVIITQSNEDHYEYALSNHILKLKNVKKDMAGQYTCSASNNNIEDKSTTTVYIRSKPTKWLVKPTEKVVKVSIGGKCELECKANGDPTPTYEWYKNGKNVPGTDPSTSGLRFEQFGGKLKMKDLELTDSGVFQCKAKNKYGEILASVYVQVIAYPPTFEGVSFGPFSLFWGERNTLKCEPDAAPKPKRNEISWEKDGVPIVIDNNKYFQDDSGNLVIAVVDYSDKGSYKCLARNSETKNNPPATATSYAIVLEPTKIIVKPKAVDTVRGEKVELVCVAKSDKTLEHMIRWYKENLLLQYDNRIQWIRGRNSLVIDPADVTDTGSYKCEAYTSYPSQSKDDARCNVIIRGPPEPPSKIALDANCAQREATISWQTNGNNYAPILKFTIEYGSKYQPGKFFFLTEKKNEGVNKMKLTDLTSYASLTFRVRAVNMIGASEPSEATDPDKCVTPQGPPTIFPKNLRGRPTTANLLDIVWDPFTKLDENAPSCYFLLSYRKKGSSEWKTEQTSGCDVEEFTVDNPGYYVLWEFKIQAINIKGQGPESDVRESRSGRDKPSRAPTGLRYTDLKPRSVGLIWDPLPSGSVDGYKVYLDSKKLNTEEELKGKENRRRRATPDNDNTRILTSPPATIKDLTPFSKYSLVMRAFTSGGEGPPSKEITFETPEDVPGPPTNVVAYPFAYYIMLRWDIPRELNGKLVGYSLDITPKSSDGKTRYNVAPNEYEYVIGGLKNNSWYNISVWARTSKGDGYKVATDLYTIFPDKPYKPEKPVVEGVSETSIKVTFMVGAGGGFPVRYNIVYRPKAADDEEVYPWIALPKQVYLSQKSVEIEDLEDRYYEFATIGYNNLGSSPQSDIVEGRPLVEPVFGKQTGQWYDEIWFIVLIIIVILLIVALLLVYVGTRKRGARYPVGKREKDRAGILDEAPPEDDGGFNNYPLKPPRTPQGSPPPYESEGSLDKSDRDSLDDYGEDEKFNEDGSFIGEYSEDKKKPQNDDDDDARDDSAFATFV